MEGAATNCLIMSYIKITCYEDIDSKNNRLQLRTVPPTFIDLKSGVNILSVKNYKDLKYGFRQDETISPSVRCDEVIEIDFSNFDGDNLVTMEGMFESMRVEQIFFGKMNTPNLKNTARAFSNVGIPIEEYHIPELDVSSFDFSNVENIMAMFQGANIDTLRMENANLNSLKNGRNFIRRCSIRKLILDGLIIQKPELLHIEIYTPVTISLKRCKPSTICALIEAIETKRIKNAEAGNVKWEPAVYILDSSLKYSLKRSTDGRVKCTITEI